MCVGGVGLGELHRRQLVRGRPELDHKDEGNFVAVLYAVPGVWNCKIALNEGYFCIIFAFLLTLRQHQEVTSLGDRFLAVDLERELSVQNQEFLKKKAIVI